MESNKPRLERLSTERLEKLLREDAVDQETIFEILSILKARDNIDPTQEAEETEAAWREFQEHYNTPEGKGQALYPTAEEKKRKSRVIIRLQKIAVAVAVVILIICMVPPAFGAENVFDLIAKWNISDFSFDVVGSVNNAEFVGDAEFEYSTDNEDLQEIYDTMQEMGVTVNVVPSWMPDGFEMVELKTSDMEAYNGISAMFSDINGNNLRFSVDVYSDIGMMGGTMYGKDNTEIEVFEFYGIDYFIMRNGNQLRAVWAVNNMECMITTSLHKDDLIRIVKSIYGDEK